MGATPIALYVELACPIPSSKPCSSFNGSIAALPVLLYGREALRDHLRRHVSTVDQAVGDCAPVNIFASKRVRRSAISRLNLQGLTEAGDHDVESRGHNQLDNFLS